MRKRLTCRPVASCSADGRIVKFDDALLTADVRAAMSAPRTGEKPHETFARLRQEAMLCAEAGCLGRAITLYKAAIDALIKADYVDFTRKYEQLALEASTEVDNLWKKLQPKGPFSSTRHEVRLAYLDIRWLSWGE